MIFQAIIFDFDGVIVDSEVVANAALAEAVTALGHPVTAEQAIERYSGLRWSDCHRAIETESGLTVDLPGLRKTVDAMVASRVADVLAIEGMGGFLERQSHRLLAIASSSDREWLDSSLERLGLARHFGDRVFSAAGLPRGKPHPDVYLMVAGALGVEPSRCLVIEDHPVGVAAGAAAGMTVVALLAAGHIRPGHESRVRSAGARHVAADYRQVAEILEELEAG
ncbi:MAG TPA: HAD family phosphatase [Allosphingosinicella sp.]|jgi:HAD superfamily hydrolase (TIGR01509 family)|nr:HAD family phosphatase [Allosphingosinicella sp.]